jgi:hypothetical protein
MNLLVNLKQFLTASLFFAAVMTIHLNVTGSMEQSSELVKKDTYRVDLKLEAEKFAYNAVK